MDVVEGYAKAREKQFNTITNLAYVVMGLIKAIMFLCFIKALIP